VKHGARQLSRWSAILVLLSATRSEAGPRPTAQDDRVAEAVAYLLKLKLPADCEWKISYRDTAFERHRATKPSVVAAPVLTQPPDLGPPYVAAPQSLFPRPGRDGHGVPGWALFAAAVTSVLSLSFALATTLRRRRYSPNGFQQSLKGKPMPKSIFISYTKADEIFAADLHEELKARGYEPFFAPAAKLEGKSFVSGINEALGRCESGLLLWSKAAAKSKWVTAEADALTRRFVEEKLAVGRRISSSERRAIDDGAVAMV
jgi:hypothetical protein